MENNNPAIEEPSLGGETAPELKAKSKKKAWLIAALCVLAILVACVFVVKHQKDRELARLAIVESGVLHPGIVIGGVSVGGMGPEEAKAAVSAAEEQMREAISLKLRFEGETFPLGADAFNVTFDTDTVIEKAMTLGRAGSLEELTAELADIAENKRAFPITYIADEAAVAQAVRALAGKVNTAPKDAAFLIETGQAGPPQAGQTEIVAPLRYEADTPGVAVDEGALVGALMKMAEEMDYKDMDLPVKEIPAAVTLEKLQSSLVLRGSAFTSYAKSPYNRASRVVNLKKATGRINCTVLAPGEVFSTNGILGDRTYSGGWEAAPAIVRGRSEDQAGGGVCQVSTTLYMAVLKSDLEIVYRQGHSGRLSYAPGGLDATIDSGRIDFKWKNSTDAPIYVFSWLNETEKTVNVEIYGTPMEYDAIALSSKQVQKLSPPGPMQYTLDPTLAPGQKEEWVKRKSGSVWKSYATYYKDGKEVKTEMLATTTYKAYAGETLVGPSAAAAPGSGQQVVVKLP